MDFLKPFDVYESREFEVWELDYILALTTQTTLSGDAREALPQACKATGEKVALKRLIEELKESDKTLQTGTLAAVSAFKSKVKEQGQSRVMSEIVAYSRKKKQPLTQVYEAFFGKETTGKHG